MNEGYRELFKTCVGSHVWHMNRPDSDKDIFKCYVAPSSDFLIGKSHNVAHFNSSNAIDIKSVEIGVLVNQLLKNDFNSFIAVMSPVVLQDSKELHELNFLTQLNLNKQCFNSIYGLAYGNYKKYILSDKQNTEKKRKLIARTILFGKHLLFCGVFNFNLYVHDVDCNEIERMLYDLKCVYENSTLPETPRVKMKCMNGY